ncbi:glycoside hydrolase family 13 protein [Nakamurella deserti]|uniref:glycoside hydrolase family 13 protein n=1 Tax=Nakamurella deserti TaxID=2164074 RepID=UPI000DBE45F3|nr:glycoside hydrolase family 13 protein [Nakamurella deserti]
MTQAGTEWWRTAVVYQVYPRSFADADGDGIGDLPGLTARLPHLAALGVDALWLTPFYPSPLADGGYDVADYRDVDPRLGTLADADALIAAAHAAGLRLIIDIVPNHTSDRHAWFVEALAAAPGSRPRQRYHFRDGTGPDGAEPPSDWVSHFGGSAWERLPDGQWYLHLFAREQPDLNWDDDEVREAFEGTLRFWADRGVDGFRIDVAHALVKDMTEPLRSQTTLDTALPLDGSDPLYDRDGLHEIYRSWRRVFDAYDPPRMAVAETWTPTSFRNYLYARPDELGQVFDFALSKAPWDRDTVADVIRTSLADQFEYAGTEGGLTWVLSSHDVPRHASRLALPAGVDPMAWVTSGDTDPTIDRAAGLRRARAATLLMLAMPGSAYLYQGEELGLFEVADLPAEVLQDPIWERTGHALKGRDGCRVPLPWSRTGPSLGFGAAAGWLPQPPAFADLSVEAQDGVEGSTLELYRAALRLRRTLQTHDNEVTTVAHPDPQVLHLRRSNGWECAVNFGTTPTALPAGEVLLASAPLDGALPGESAVWSRTTGISASD